MFTEVAGNKFPQTIVIGNVEKIGTPFINIVSNSRAQIGHGKLFSSLPFPYDKLCQLGFHTPYYILQLKKFFTFWIYRRVKKATLERLMAEAKERLIHQPCRGTKVQNHTHLQS